METKKTETGERAERTLGKDREAACEEHNASEAREAFGVRIRRVVDRARVIEILKGVFLLLLAFLLDRCVWLSSTRPFGIALLAGAESGVVFIFCGILLSALPILGGAWYPIGLLAATVVVLLRIGVRMTVDLPWERGEAPEIHAVGVLRAALFREHVALRMAISAVGAFLPGLYRMIGGGYMVYDLLMAILSLTVSPLFALIYAKVWRREVWESERLSDFLSTVFAILAPVLALSTAQISLYGISGAVLLAMGVTLYTAHRLGIPHGILAGLLLGIAADPVTAPMYAFGAVAFGVLRRVSMLLGALSALTVGMAWGLYVYGLSALSMLFPAILTASLLFCVLEKLGFLPFLKRGAVEGVKDDAEAIPERVREERESLRHGDGAEGERIRFLQTVLAAERLRDEERKIEDLCGAFLSVSDLLGALREDSRCPSVEEYRRACDRVCDEFCPGCASCSACWGCDYAEMTATLNGLAEAMHASGRAEESMLPEALRARCGSFTVLLSRMNEEAARLSEDKMKREHAGLLSADYSAAATLFRSASRNRFGAYGIDEKRSARARELFLRFRIEAACVAVTGGSRGCLYAWNVDRTAIGEAFTGVGRVRLWEEALGFLPGDAIVSPIPSGEGLCDLRVPAAPRYTVRHASASVSARIDGREGGLCGDSVAFFESGDGRSFALLSDGMGSGRNAAHLSGICAVFLQKMLSAGGETGVILRMLNDFLAAGATGESSATVDLFEFDTHTGEGYFWKSGAAPTFVLRGGNLLRITARTAPAGILPELDVQRIAFDLQSGDVVVMVSDGIGEGEEDLMAVSLSAGDPTDEAALRKTAERIARGNADSVKSDDRSVILFAVSRTETDEGEEVLKEVG